MKCDNFASHHIPSYLVNVNDISYYGVHIILVDSSGGTTSTDEEVVMIQIRHSKLRFLSSYEQLLSHQKEESTKGITSTSFSYRQL